MSSKTSRLLAAALLLSTLTVLAPPAHGLPSRPRLRDDNRVFAPVRAFFSLLNRLFEQAGGAMDPNGFD